MGLVAVAVAVAGLSPGRSVYGEAVAGSNAYCEPETRSVGVSETPGLTPDICVTEPMDGARQVT